MPQLFISGFSEQVQWSLCVQMFDQWTNREIEGILEKSEKTGVSRSMETNYLSEIDSEQSAGWKERTYG